MRDNTSNRVALGTGAASDMGIGRAIALGFGRNGARVACVDRDLEGCRQAARQIRQRSGGCILNISSISSEQAAEQKVHYYVAKAGVKMLTECLALQLGRHLWRDAAETKMRGEPR